MTLRSIPLLALPLLLLACSGEEPTKPRTRPGAPAPIGPGDAAASEEEPLTTVRIEPAVHDFGEVWRGAVLERLFLVEVTGDEPLSVLKAKPSCSCTVPELTWVNPDGVRGTYELGSPIPPGSVLEVRVVMDTERLQGPQSKNVKLFGNVPGGASELVVRADVKRFVEASLARWDAGRFTLAESRSGEVEITSPAGEPFALALDTTDLPAYFRADLEPVEPDDDGRSARWRVAMELGPVDLKGMIHFEVRFVTDRENEMGGAGPDGGTPLHDLELGVSASIVGVVTASPSFLNLGTVGRDAVTAKTIRLAAGAGAARLPEPDVRVLDDAGEPLAWAERFTFTTRPVADVNAWDVEVLLDGIPEDVPRSFNGRFVIETGVPAEPTLTVSFAGYVKRRPSTERAAPAGEEPAGSD
jgi:hypothetical protein